MPCFHRDPSWHPVSTSSLTHAKEWLSEGCLLGIWINSVILGGLKI